METMSGTGDHDRKAIEQLEQEWRTDRRWAGVERPYSAADVVRLRGTLLPEHTLARRGAERLWHLLQTEPFIRTFGALTGNQAVQMVQAGLKAIYVSGWQVAGDIEQRPPDLP
jgi:isocitrate lyase